MSAGTIPQQWDLAPSLSTDSLSPHEREAARWSPDREILELAEAGAATVLGALKTKCTSCDDRHIGVRKDALYLD